MRYNKSDINAALKAAEKAVDTDGTTRYVFASALGFQVSTQRPPFGQQHCRVSSKEGQVFVPFRMTWVKPMGGI